MVGRVGGTHEELKLCLQEETVRMLLIAFIAPKSQNSSEKDGDDCVLYEIAEVPQRKPQLREASSGINLRSALCLVLLPREDSGPILQYL